MKWTEYSIARTYAQLLAASKQRVLNDKETRLLATLTPCVEQYEARETQPLNDRGVAR